MITPSQITATQNDYNPTNWDTATLVRLSGDSSFQKITGFDAETDGEEKTLINVGSYSLYIAPEHTGSTAANRVSHYEEILLVPGGSCRIYYDSTSSRWRVSASTSENYYAQGKGVQYDKYGAKFPEGITEDIILSYAGSGALGTATPTSTRPFVSFSMDNAGNATGDVSLYMSKATDAVSYVGASHLVTKCAFTTPSSLSTSGQRYRLRHIITGSPATLLTNVNNTVGIRYADDINSGKFELYSRNSGGTETTADSGITVAANTRYETAVSINKAGNEATFFINGAVVGRITTNLPTSTTLGTAIHYNKLVGTTTYTFYVDRLMAAAIIA